MTTQGPPIVNVDDLTRTFQRRKLHRGKLGTLRTLASRQSDTIEAVSGVSFAINAGEMVGYIGQNGAGKSTTIKMLCGILVPSEGYASVLGVTPWEQRKQLARRIGVVLCPARELRGRLPLLASLDRHRPLGRVPRGRFAAHPLTARELPDRRC